MITDLMCNLQNYRGLHKNLDTAIAFLESCDLGALADGKTIIDGDRVFINVMEADLRAAEGAEYEYHKRYADLQLNLSGSEYWEWTADGSVQKPFDEMTDFGLAGGESQSGGTLGNGRFVLFLPNEFHKPSCVNGACHHVRKAVVKIEMV